MPPVDAKLCICEICNCGRHRCPHVRQKPEITGPCGISEYSTQYVPRKINLVESCKPAHHYIEKDGPISSDTTNRTDYVSHPLSIQPSCKKVTPYEPSGVAFDALSTYNKEYTPKSGAPAVSVKPQHHRNVTAKFEGEPTYTADYRAWKLEARNPNCGPHANWNPPTIPFQGIPVYTSDYIPHHVQPPASCKPIAQISDNRAPFSGTTDYRDAYRVPSLADRAHPIKNESVVQRSTAPMEGTSTHMADFDWKTAVPPQSCKPAHHGIQDQSPFQDDTTHRTDYKQWPLTGRATPLMNHEAYRGPEGEMSGDTTYNKDYIPFGLSSRTPIRKLDNLGRTIDLPPFEGVSDYRDSYRRWSIGPRDKGASRESAYVKPTIPFEGHSTSKQHYISHVGHRPAPSCKPMAQTMCNKMPFDDATLYRTEYTPKCVVPCPAALLNSQKSDFVYQELNQTGHQLYTRKSLMAVAN